MWPLSHVALIVFLFYLLSFSMTSIIPLSEKLRSLRLDQRGNREVRKNRLKSYYRTEKLEEAYKKDPKIELYKYFDYYLVIDFEATCDAGNSQTYRWETRKWLVLLYENLSFYPLIYISSFSCVLDVYLFFYTQESVMSV